VTKDKAAEDIKASEPLFGALYDDVEFCYALMRSKDSQETRRLFVRAAFGFIEGMLWWLKTIIIRTDRARVRLSLPEIVLLRERAFDLTDSGEVKERSANLRFKNNLLFTFKTHAKAFEYPSVLALDGEGWARLQEAVVLRDKLMHPKDPADLSISDDAIANTLKGYWWFRTTVADALEASSEAMRMTTQTPESEQE
jgi:hypothetical protein